MSWARPPLVLIAAYALLMSSYVAGNAPFAAPDERFHYLRAMALAQGEVVGEPATFPPEEAAPLTPEMHAWVNQSARSFPVWPEMSPMGYECQVGRSDHPATCMDAVEPSRVAGEEISLVGNYQPLPYLLPAIAIGAAHWVPPLRDPAIAAGMARVMMLIATVALLGGAVFLLWRNGATFALAGVALAVTPLVVFTGATVNSSAVEMAAGISLVAALVRIADDAPRGAWWWAGSSAAVLALSRSTGSLWVLFHLLVFVVWCGARPSIELLRRHHRVAAPAGCVAAAGVAAATAWELLHGSSTTVSIRPIGAAFGSAIDQLPVVFQSAIGRLGSLEVALPWPAYAGWRAGLVALLALAFLVGTSRHRWALAAVSAASLAVPMLFFAAVYRHTGFGQQGRHVMPIAVAVPLLAGEVLHRNRARFGRVRPRLLLLWVALPVAVVHFLAWWANARRHAVGTQGPIFFVGRSDWAPVLGWAPHALLALAGAIALVSAAVSAIRFERYFANDAANAA